MVCRKCGTLLADGDPYCRKCGETTLRRTTSERKPTFGANNWLDDGIMPGGFEAGQPAEIKNLGEYRPPRKSKLKIVGIIISALIILAGLAILSYTVIIPFFTKGPLEKFQDALIKTSNAESMTMSFKYTVDDSQTLSGKMKVAYSVEDKTADGYFEMTVSGIAMKGYFLADEKGGYAAVYVDMLGQYTAQKVLDADEMEDFFESLKDAETNAAKMYDEMGDLLDEQYGSVFDFSDFGELMEEVIDELDKSKNRKEIMGYEKEKDGALTIHKMEPDVYKLADKVLDIAEDRFDDESTFDELKSAMKANKESAADLDLKLSFGIEKGYLSSFEVSMNTEEGVGQMVIELSHINDTEVTVDSAAEAAIRSVQ